MNYDDLYCPACHFATYCCICKESGVKMCRHIGTVFMCKVCSSYKEGRDACNRGEPQDSDPYVADAVCRKSWRDGWMFQHRVNQVPKSPGPVRGEPFETCDDCGAKELRSHLHSFGEGIHRKLCDRCYERDHARDKA